jgi:hypothetical protein
MPSLRILFGSVLFVGFSAAAQAATLSGYMWLVPNSGPLIATLPEPAATPDATFSTDHVSFFMTAPCCGDPAFGTVNNTIARFLNSANPVKYLRSTSALQPGSELRARGQNKLVASQTGFM